MRKKSKHLLTSLGKVVYESQVLVGQAFEDNWKLKAIDSIEASLFEDDLSVEKRKRMIDTLIERDNIKNILLNHNIPLVNNHKISGRITPTTPEMAHRGHHSNGGNIEDEEVMRWLMLHPGVTKSNQGN